MRKMKRYLGIKLKKASLCFPLDQTVKDFTPSKFPSRIISDTATFDLLVLGLEKSGIRLDDWYFNVYTEFKEYLLNKVAMLQQQQRKKKVAKMGISEIDMYKRIPNTKTLVHIRIDSLHYGNDTDHGFSVFITLTTNKQVEIEFARLESEIIERIIFSPQATELIDPI